MPLLTNRIGQPLIQLQSVDSTNNYAMARVHEGMAQHGYAVVTALQTGGRGQRNKGWSSQENKNLLCSIVFEPSLLNFSDAFLLSMACALSVQQVFNKYAGNECRIKWPNDLYWRDRKAGGILIENIVQGSKWKFAIIGIGVNINQTHFDDLSSKAVSLKQVTGKDWDVLQFAQELFLQMEHTLPQLAVDGANRIIDAYHQQLYRINENIRLKKEGRVFQALLKRVERDGTLVVQTAVEERFTAGEVEWLI